MPASSRIARTPPPAMTPVPSLAGRSRTRAASERPITSCGIVVPFRGLAGKQRLTGLGADTHRAVVLAMLADVLAATTIVGETVVVTNDDDGRRLAIQEDWLADYVGITAKSVLPQSMTDD